ncbi:dTDP-4-dehydrorhamnose 3,5-epimerase family protein [Lysobacter sp. CFH 32150]|uniref:dTDP-4-dehydrorhamnose 3,5-epimerase family protein n=1 Tax=Lysobacter sp. CFH 32150 TaxID=2927128 RepID=UPI001FA7E707|nr:dTDP-4-dehydrorhamnose 3,5-epimerase family protein [Lysobacter sp. CFH 32150]MCI4567726.1 dTDP-4-dehydrorhamnose 3,5-epimerase family protein [Lysobacter sp. CFH 32150]
MTRRFEVLDAPLGGLKIIQRMPIGDSRGYLERLYCADEFEGCLVGRSIVQINRSLTLRMGTVRGMHYQRSPHAETKFVSCLRGEAFDVAVDLRPDSPTFRSWHAEILSADNHRTMMIPEGFAHGFQALSDDCELLYFHTEAYQQAFEAGLHPEDPGLAIRWPVPIAEMSPRDSAHAFMTENFRGVEA